MPLNQQLQFWAICTYHLPAAYRIVTRFASLTVSDTWRYVYL